MKNNEKIPESAREKILAILFCKLRISTDTMLNIIERETGQPIEGKTDRRIWLARCQSIMSSIRNEKGERLVFNVPNRPFQAGSTDYVFVHTCGDARELKAINHRLHENVVGLEQSLSIVDEQLGFTETADGYLGR